MAVSGEWRRLRVARSHWRPSVLFHSNEFSERFRVTATFTRAAISTHARAHAHHTNQSREKFTCDTPAHSHDTLTPTTPRFPSSCSQREVGKGEVHPGCGPVRAPRDASGSALWPHFGAPPAHGSPLNRCILSFSAPMQQKRMSSGNVCDAVFDARLAHALFPAAHCAVA